MGEGCEGRRLGSDRRRFGTGGPLLAFPGGRAEPGKPNACKPTPTRADARATRAVGAKGGVGQRRGSAAGAAGRVAGAVRLAACGRARHAARDAEVCFGEAAGKVGGRQAWQATASLIDGGRCEVRRPGVAALWRQRSSSCGTRAPSKPEQTSQCLRPQSPVQTPIKHDPMGHRVPLASGVGALHKPVAGSQVRGAWQLVDGHVTLPAAQRSVGQVGRQDGQAAGLAGQPTHGRGGRGAR
jgi:hypothetical protein